MEKIERIDNECDKVVASVKMNLIIIQSNNGSMVPFISKIELKDAKGEIVIKSRKNEEKNIKILKSKIIIAKQFNVSVFLKITNSTKKTFFNKSGGWKLIKIAEIIQKKIIKIKNLREFCNDYHIVLDNYNILDGEISLVSKQNMI